MVFEYFPRIIRKKDDSRARRNNEYKSSIAKLLKLFEEFSQQDEYSKFDPLSALPANNETKRLLENFGIIQELGKFLCDEDLLIFKQEFDYYSVSRESFKLSQMQSLFRNNPKPNYISKICEEPEVQGIVRLLLFSAYLLHFVILTWIETSDEDLAFDLFDALNTTGEPLTAIETLKPLVVEFESQSRLVFEGSQSAHQYDRIEKNLSAEFDKTKEKQAETKELLTSFALYFEGRRLANELSGQRNYLRQNFKQIESPSGKLKFVEAIADVAEFRNDFWMPRGKLARNLDFNSIENEKWVQLCLALLRDMKTKLTVPIIARFWWEYKQQKNKGFGEDDFVSSVKALTAFVVIRRSYTGGTDGIDNVFRQLMRGDEKGTRPLCIGSKFDNQIWSVKELKCQLLAELYKKMKLSTPSNDDFKGTWVNKTKSVDLYKSSNQLCRFLLLAATNNTVLGDSPGLLKKTGVPSNTTNVFFNIERWKDENFQTVEHIAPQDQPSGSAKLWEEEIYRDRGVQHTIGNLTLLPGKSNSSLSNQNWNGKRTYYRIFADRNINNRKEYIDIAREKGIEIKSSTEKLISETYHLQILESIVNVEYWTKQIIENRSENILELAWNTIIGWLISKNSE